MTTTTKRRSSFDKFNSEVLWGDHQGQGEGYLVHVAQTTWGGTVVYLLDVEAAGRLAVVPESGPSQMWLPKSVGFFFTFDTDGRFDGASHIKLGCDRHTGEFWFSARANGPRGNHEYSTFKAAVSAALTEGPRHRREREKTAEIQRQGAVRREQEKRAEIRRLRQSPIVQEARQELDRQIERARQEARSNLSFLAKRFAELAEEVDGEYGVMSSLPHQGITDTIKQVGTLNALLLVRQRAAGLFHPVYDSGE